MAVDTQSFAYLMKQLVDSKAPVVPAEGEVPADGDSVAKEAIIRTLATAVVNAVAPGTPVLAAVVQEIVASVGDEVWDYFTKKGEGE